MAKKDIGRRKQSHREILNAPRKVPISEEGGEKRKGGVLKKGEISIGGEIQKRKKPVQKKKTT